LISHYLDKRERDREDAISLIEYLALLTSFNPKGVSKIIAARKKQKSIRENQAEKDKYYSVNSSGKNEFGQTVNTTFFEDIKKYGGEDALDNFGEDAQDYKIKTEESTDEAIDEELDEDDKFLAEAKKMFAEREKEIEEEEKFKKEHPELFDVDEILF